MILSEPRKCNLKPFLCKALKSQGLMIVLVLD